MKKLSILISLILIFGINNFASNFIDPATDAHVTPVVSAVGSDYKLTFTDEFNGNEVDPNKWNIDNSSQSRNARPGLSINNWFWRPSNVEVKDGNLVLKVSKYNSNTMHCGSINSKDKFASTYGYFEARIKIAEAAKGTHTAFWLQGKGMGNVDGTANDGAEIDIFESAWLEDYTKSVLHIDGYGSNHKANTKKYTTPGIHEGFHTFSLYWTKDFLKIYYDGLLKVTYNEAQWLVHSDEYLWLSGGASFGFSGDHFTSAAIGYLTEAHVDYIRVWTLQEENDSDELVKNGEFEDSLNTAWKSADNYTDVIYSDSNFPVANGQYCRLPGASQSRAITQDIELSPNQSYTFSFSGRIHNAAGESGSSINDKDGKGPATLKAEITSEQTVLKSFTIDSNNNTSVTGEFTVPQDQSTITLKLSKNWNIAYIDNVSIKPINTTSINNLHITKCSLYPNPTQGSTTLSCNYTINSYNIYNTLGQVVETGSNINAKQIGINTSQLNKGKYVVSVKDNFQKKDCMKLLVK